ncbi:hypothetical protein BI292_25975 [Pseudomonas sp. 43NM1]|uniref:phage tail protein n=1 Tax=Pseudomonas sp. 43NM1 TaxID=1904755 RepID=UPI000CB4859A|nr:phage tail protein [Pseudomonas sp. 43NM1]PKH35127.1 hypothetical protein BI292_25975 [Pseudomonas sp. 43NM1]
MIDANSQFFAILTKVGRAKQANADALGIPWKITEMGVGDANDTDPIPSEAQTRLINEWRRRPLNQLRIDPANTAVIIAEQIIPADEGGRWIREIGLYDADGDLVAVANCAPSFKPMLSQGSGRTQVVRMNFIVTSTGNITLKIDPAVVLATREYVDLRITEELYKLDSKQSVRVATTANIALAGLLTIDGIALAAGDRVLVKNQTVAKDNGLYLAAAGVWKRAEDADTNAEVTSALLVAVEQGGALADTRWQLVTDGVIVLGTTPLVFQDVTQGYAPINSPAFLGAPTANTAEPGNNSRQVANTEFVASAVEKAVNGATTVSVAGSGSTLLTAAQVRAGVLYLNGTLTGNKTVIVPTEPARFQVCNTTTGPFTLTVKTAAGSGILVTQSMCSLLFCDGASVFLQQSDFVSPIFRGVPRTPLPPRFDVSDQVMSASAVSSRGQQYSTFTAFDGPLHGTVGHVGGVVHCSGSGGANAYSLPSTAANNIPPGATVRVQNWGAYDLSLSVQGGDNMQENIDGVWSPATRAIPADSYVDCMHIGAGMWLLAGTGVVGKTRPWAFMSGESGYQKLPSGLIIQWFTAPFAQAYQAVPFNLPIAFTKGNFGCNVSLTSSAIYASGGSPHVAGMPNGLGQVLLQSNYTASQSAVRVLAFGM